MHIHVGIFLKYDLSVHLMLSECMLSELFGTNQPAGRLLFPGKGHISCSRISSFIYSSLCGVETSRASVCPAWRVHW